MVLKNFATLSSEERSTFAQRVVKLERKVFPKDEGFNYDIELKKKNIGLILTVNEGASDQLVAYLVYQRMRRVVWLHKLCVVEQERKKGIGRCLVHALRDQMEKGGGETIQLWVDEHRQPAKSLYEACGFVLVETRPAYYAPGRAGLKMELPIAR
ncbi:hypothetical protein ACEQ8H_001513 [Pleosporales sp. CAS-2024a]